MYVQDYGAPGAGVCLLDGGHFLLESHPGAVTGTVGGSLEGAVDGGGCGARRLT
jgi:hypothetical protein